MGKAHEVGDCEWALETFLSAQILASGKTSYLHVKSENEAKVVYQKIGFRLRAAIWLTVISLRQRRGQLRNVPSLDPGRQTAKQKLIQSAHNFRSAFKSPLTVCWGKTS